MDDDQPPYSRDEFISELTSYYEFLVKMYLPASAIKYPPEGGWPDITPSYLAFKTETVNDLIRHMPFIRQDRPPAWPYQIYDKTSAVDYNGPEVKASLSLNPNNPESVDPLREEITTLPPHVMTFARTSGGRDGFYFFFDTERGTATMADFQYGPTHTELSLPFDENTSTEAWREHATYSVREFFELLKEHFRSLKMIPITATDIEVAPRDAQSEYDSVIEVYHKYGWPSDDYNKEECMKCVEETWEKSNGRG